MTDGNHVEWCVCENMKHLSGGTQMFDRLIFCLIILSLSVGASADFPDRSPRDVWLLAETRIENVLADQKRSEVDLESPVWYETPYQMLGRMPLIDLALNRPLVLPEIALWVNQEADTDAGFRDLLILSERLSEADPIRVSLDIESLKTELGSRPLDDRITIAMQSFPEDLGSLVTILYRGISAAQDYRDRACATLTPYERDRMKILVPGYFIKKEDASEAVRGYTTEVGDCIELFELLQKVDFETMIHGAHLLMTALDDAIQFVQTHDLIHTVDQPLRIDSAIGLIALGGETDDVYTEDVTLSIDTGGSDRYLNHAAHTDIDLPGAAVLFDLEGDDVYASDGSAQASAMSGYAALIDFDGDDRYLAKHYSQGAALVGFSAFADFAGDDQYNGDFGVQGFSIFGASLFIENAGRDTYRNAAMGQAAASTLGVAIILEREGDDVYRSGGKYDFYFPWDSSTAQGAGSGMRAWPPINRFSVYGGAGVLIEKSGNDEYSAYNVGQGGSYFFATGILVDSAGNDLYTSKNYCRGVGVHLSAAVALDLAGDDIHTGLYGQNGYSLDRSSGVFADFGGNDIYRSTGAMGFGHKPRGTGIFLDLDGDDLYAGTENNYGRADVPYADDQFSTGFFFDWGGFDMYSRGPYANDSSWAEGEFGFGEDRSIPPEIQEASPRWRLDDGHEAGSGSHSLIRNHQMGRIREDVRRSGDALWTITRSAHWQDRDLLIDLLPFLRRDPAFTDSSGYAFRDLLDSSDRNVLLSILIDMRDHPVALNSDLEKRLVQLVTTACHEVRGMACGTLAACDPESDWTLETLSTALRDSDWRVRRRAAIAFGKLRNPRALERLRDSMRNDPAFQVRAHALSSATAFTDPGVAIEWERALTDPSELVQCIAARSLIIEKQRKEAFGTLIDLWDWDSRILRETWLLEFLNEFCGTSFSDRAQLESWWNQTQRSGRFGKCLKGYKQYQEARKLKGGADLDAFTQALEKVLKVRPDHTSARVELSQVLNGAAWELAVTGSQLQKAEKLAIRSVELDPNSMNHDTLAVVLYRSGKKEAARELLNNWRKKAMESDWESIDARLDDLKSGQLQLR